MNKKLIQYELKSTEAFFLHVVGVFSEEDAGHRPEPGTMSVAEQVAHVGQTVDWFLEGITRPEGFDLNFEEHLRQVQAVGSLAEAKDWVIRGFAKMLAYIDSLSEAAIMEALPGGPILGTAPRATAFLGIIDHTAHHRGALSVYARSLGKTPPVPYEVATPWEA